ncbi:MAG TPA: ATP-dependent DNA ligase, partial [Candidatus Methylomirabilis sp.]|nr:ATP-dependent DNA ligase [Candidatus Methylomirabilis sp.]
MGARRAPLTAAPAPQLATLVDAPPEGDGWVHEIKYDGYRLLLRIEGRKAKLLTRRGNDWTDRFPTLARAALDLPVSAAILDGEVVKLNAAGISEFQSLQNAIGSSAERDLYYYAFDLLHLDGFDLTAASLLDRKTMLGELLEGTEDPIRYSDHVQGQGKAFFEAACRHGLEGMVSKRAD